MINIEENLKKRMCSIMKKKIQAANSMATWMKRSEIIS
jgi:hypothetical protein